MKKYFLMYKDEKVVELNGVSKVVLAPDLLPWTLRARAILYEDIVKWAKDRVMPSLRANATLIADAYKLKLSDLGDIIKANHLASLHDNFWFKEENEKVTWKDVTLHTNDFDEWVSYRALLGVSSVATPKKPSPELTTKGCAPKAWFKLNDGIYLFKVGKYELAASEIMNELGINHAEYEEVKPVELMRYIPSALVAGFFNKTQDKVVKCKCFTNQDLGYVTWEEFEKYVGSRANAYEQLANGQYARNYYEMLVIDYICNNTERYSDDWGFLIGRTSYFEMAPLSNFDQAFSNTSGALSKTTYKQLRMEDAAKFAIKHTNLYLENVLAMKKPEVLTDAQWKQVKARVQVLIDFKRNTTRSSDAEVKRLKQSISPTSLFG